MEIVVKYGVGVLGSGGYEIQTINLGIDADEIEVLNLSGVEEDGAPLFFTVDGDDPDAYTDGCEVVPVDSALTVIRKAAGWAVVKVAGDGQFCVRGIKR
jgi:hypothetical protein